MDTSEIICTTNTCSIKSAHKNVKFKFRDNNYILNFEDDKIEKSHGFILKNIDNNKIDDYLLRCLMIYFGENIIKNDEIDTFYSFTRGTFTFKEKQFIKIIHKLENFPYPSYPLWKKRLIFQAIRYYELGVTNGINLMPINIGFFALSIECIANAYYGKTDKYYELGNNYINNLILTRLKKYKINNKYRVSAKKLEKRLQIEVDILRELRNFYYAHSFSHIKKERIQIANKLKKWAIQYGLNPLLANAFFKENNFEWGLHMQKHNLYNLGLRINRMMIFFLIGFTNSIPFASHDFNLNGESMKGKTLKRNGLEIVVK